MTFTAIFAPMNRGIDPYLPVEAVDPCRKLLGKYKVELRVVGKRVTRHGDYRRLPDGQHLITLNITPNPYRFLLTFIHELAHLVAFESWSRSIKPHGPEWKESFRELMLPFLRPDIFPDELLPSLARHFKNPKASSSTDMDLALALREYDPPSDLVVVMDVPEGECFRLYNGRVYRRGKQRVKRIECIELPKGRRYLFQPNAEVELLENKK